MEKDTKGAREAVRSDSDSARELEAEEVSKLRFYLDEFQRHEPWLKKLALRKFSPDQVAEVEGRRCVLAVSRLKYHDLVLFFQVNTASIKEVEPFDGYDTWIECPLQMVNDVFARTLSGEEDSFNDALGDNRVKIRGKKVYYDTSMFSDVFNLLARNIRKFREATR